MKEIQSAREGKRPKKKKKGIEEGGRKAQKSIRKVHETNLGVLSSSPCISSSSLETQLDFTANELNLTCPLKVQTIKTKAGSS